MSDPIDRQAAIDEIKEIYEWHDNVTKERIIEHFKQLPSAERTGRWIENEFGAYCSECGLYAYRSNGIPWKSNYCPMCGARLEATK